MASLEHLDMLLGDALERLVEASDEVRGINQLEQKEILKRIGRAVSELWGVRNQIYQLEPGLKRDFVIEHEQNRERFETLNELYKRAYEKEKNGDTDAARSLFKELYGASSFGYFRLLAEAGLFRLSR